MTNDMQENVKSLIKKAEKAEKSDDALKFSQAACNSANALLTMLSLEEK